MASNTKFFIKIFSPRIIAKAMVTLDKSTAVIVSACWLAAFVTLVLAVFAVHGAVSAKKEAAEAMAAEPALPQVSTSPMPQRESQIFLDRLQHQFPDLKFEVGPNQSFLLKSNDGSKFHQWITAIGYVDSMAPDYRWTLSDFCVGSCSAAELMRAQISGQKITFSLPSH